MSAVPVPDPRRAAKRERILLVGDLPSPNNPPPGCVFHTRCPKFREELSDAEKDQCRTVVPVLEEKLPGHRVACHFAAQTSLDLGSNVAADHTAADHTRPDHAAAGGGSGPSLTKS